MRQQINLNQDLPKVSRFRVNQKLFEKICLMGQAVVIVIVVFQFIHLNYLTYRSALLQDGLKNADQSKQLRQNAQIMVLQQQLQRKLARLQSLPIVPPLKCYFSNNLQSLAAAKQVGIWLTEMHFSIAKNSVVLNGKTIAPILLSNWLSRLAQTPCFDQQKFNLLSVNQGSVKQAANFTLSSAGKL